MTSFRPIILSQKSETHTLSLHILPFGLTLHRLLLTSNSDAKQVQDLLTGPEEPQDHEKFDRCFFGPIVGRFANRLPAGKSQYDDGEVNLLEWGGSSISHHGGPPTENPSSPTSLLQSGPFDRCIWQPLEPNQSLLFKTSTNSDQSQLFGIESPSDDNGYPGKIRVEVLIRLLPSSTSNDASLGSSIGRISIVYRSKLLDATSSTPINLTHHWGFNLSASNSDDVEDEVIDSHYLQIFPSNTTTNSDQVQLLETDSVSGIPTGHYSSTKGTCHDFMTRRKIRDESFGFLEGGHDHFYIFGPPKHNQKSSVILTSEKSGLSISFKTNQSGVQLYTANGQPKPPAPIEAGGRRKILHGKSGGDQKVGNPQRSAAFLEFSHPHGNFLHKKLREISGSDTLLRKDDKVEEGEGENWVEVEVWKK